jgi:hypothetical protein
VIHKNYRINGTDKFKRQWNIITKEFYQGFIVEKKDKIMHVGCMSNIE